MRYLIFFTTFCCICFTNLSAQQLQVSTGDDWQDMVTQFIDSDCETIKETQVINSGIGQQLNSYGSFTASGNTGFQLSSGIVLTTGNAANAGVEGASNITGIKQDWSGSELYEQTLGLAAGTTHNATELSFSFQALRSDIVFEYVFASEDYVTDKVCDSNEGVVILIKEQGEPDSAFENIALVPNTTIPVTIATINNGRTVNPICPPSHSDYIGGARGISTPFPNYSLYTKTLPAYTHSEIGKVYDVRVIVVDEIDAAFDSAVFIQDIDNDLEFDFIASNPTSGGQYVVSNSNRVEVCASSILLDVEISGIATAFNYEWRRDNQKVGSDQELQVTTSGDYEVRVYVTGTCYVSDTIRVDIGNQQMGNSLPDLRECIPNTQASTVSFDFTSQASRALSGYNATEVLFYDSNNNLITTPTNYEVTATAETIKAVVNESSGCVYTSEFDISFEQIDNFLEPVYILPMCDTDANNNGSVTVYPEDVEAILPTITSGTYRIYNTSGHLMGSQGRPTRSTIPTGMGAFEVVYTSVSGCTFSADLEIDVSQPPEVDDTLGHILACDIGLDDKDQDGKASFDLSEKHQLLVDELNDNTLTITYYPSVAQAEEGNLANQILDITNVRTSDQYMQDFVQHVGVRIENTSGCIGLSSIELRPRYLISDILLTGVESCDDDDDGYTDFNLQFKKQSIANGTTHEISIHTSYSDAEQGINELSDTELLSFENQKPDTQKLWVRVRDIDTGCVDYDEEYGFFELTVLELPVIETPQDPIPSECALTSSGEITGLVSYFNEHVREQLSDQYEDLDFFYFDYDITTSAIVNIGTALRNSDTNDPASPTQTYYAIARNSNGCVSNIISFEFTVEPAPEVYKISLDPLYHCYDSADNLLPIDISHELSDLLTNTSNIELTYYTSREGAEDLDEDYQIIDPKQDFSTLKSMSVYLRLTNTQTSCYTLVRQYVISSQIPEVLPVSDMSICVVDKTATGGFLLQEKDEEVLQGRSGLKVRYFETEFAAQNAGDPNADPNLEIPSGIPYNASSGTSVYVRIENIYDPNCFNDNAIIHFQLILGEYPVVDLAVRDLVECGVFGVGVFDLNGVIDDLTEDGQISNLNIRFYKSSRSAQEQDMALEVVSDTTDGTFLYTNETPLSQKLFVRIENEDECPIYEDITLIIDEVPYASPIENFEFCDIGYDQSEKIDLTVIESFEYLDFDQMARPITDISILTFDYFTTREGAEAFVSDDTSVQDKITTPNDFEINTIGETNLFLVISNSKAISVDGDCGYVFPFGVTLYSLPNYYETIIEDCERSFGSNDYILTLDSLQDSYNFFRDTNAVIKVDYFQDSMGNMPLEGEVLKDASLTAIYTQATIESVGCKTDIYTIPLGIHPLPDVYPLSSDQTSICVEDRYDEDEDQLIYNFSNLNASILYGRSSLDYEVSYFKTEEETADNTKKITCLLYTSPSPRDA